MSNTNKPWYKKFKVQVAIATAILVAVTSAFPQIPVIIIQAILALGISIIGGHAFTDALAALKK